MRELFRDPYIRSLTQEIPPEMRKAMDESEAKIRAMDDE